MRSRLVFDSLEELRNYVMEQGNRIGKKTPYIVTINGVTRYVLAGNTDHAIATMVREICKVEVATIPIMAMV